MTKNEYIAKVLRTHQTNLLKLLAQYDMGALDQVFEEMQASLGNVAAELVKLPSPAMANGHQRQKFDPTPNSTVVAPKPKPRKPAPAAMVAA